MIKKTCLTGLLVLLPSPLPADLAPLVKPTPYRPVFPKPEGSLTKGDVDVKIQGAGKGDGTGGFRAVVNCEFVVERDPDGKGTVKGDDVRWVFPFAGKDERVDLKDFKVTIEGRPVLGLQTLQDWPLPADPETGYQAICWSVPAGLASPVHVRVAYTLEKPLEAGKGSFRYVLRSGGGWDRPLGREQVTITVDGFSVKAQKGRTLEPDEAAGDHLRWDLHSVRPSQDILVSLSRKE